MKQTKTKPEKREKTAQRKPTLTPIYVIAVVVVTYFLAQILAGVVIGGVAALFGADANAIVAKLSEPAWQFGYVLIFEAITLGFIYLAMKLYETKLSEIGLGRKPVLSDVGYGLVTFAIYFLTLLAVTAFIKAFVTSIDVEQEQQIVFEGASTSLDLTLAFIALVILVPIAEEIMVRGFLYAGLRSKLTKVTAALVASFIFGVAHLQLETGNIPLWIAAVDTFILSLFLIALREKTNSLWAGIIVHATKNGFAFWALFIYGPEFAVQLI
jgi:membrane protease YdiL (CAAX protease family)